jgi:thiol:disulfide interchange protein DsbA
LGQQDMKKLLSILFLSLGFVSAAVEASPAAPVAGTDYIVLSPAQPVDVPAGKIEVTEFFWYGCPHCNEFNPYLETWIKKQGPDVVFKRVPVAFRDDFIPHSRMYHALDALGLAQKLTPIVFNEIHVNKDYLLTPEDQAKFLAKNGVDPQKYLAAYNSFSTQSEIQRDKKLLDDYKIDGVPTLAVQGKYETGPAATNSLPGTIQVLDYLVAQIRAKKM